MRMMSLAVAVLGGCAMLACTNDPVQRVQVKGPEDASTYPPVREPKPLPTTPPPQPISGMGGQLTPIGAIQNEEAFVNAYTNQRSPRIMVFVNRTIQGDPLPKDGFTQAVTGTWTGNGNSGTFTAVKKPSEKVDSFGVTSEDYQLIELSIMKYFDNSGRVRVQDSEAARAKLSREQVLRIENGDPAANRLLATELQQDILIRVTAFPTQQSSAGPAVRLIAKAVATTDARILGTAMGDMRLPMSQTNVNVWTQHIASELMGDMARKWLQPPEYTPTEVRIYKVATVDDALKLRTWLQSTKGVKSVNTNGATGGSTTAYASFAVGFAGAPEDLYAELKTAIGLSQGIKAVDVSNNTIALEVTGQMNLVTTTMRQETRTTTEVKTTEERRVDPISPATGPGR